MSDNNKFVLPALPYNANDLAPTIVIDKPWIYIMENTIKHI